MFHINEEYITYEKSILDWRTNTRIKLTKVKFHLLIPNRIFQKFFVDRQKPLFCYKPSFFPVSHRVISMQTSPWTWSLGVTFEALLFWYTAYKTRNFTFEAYLFWFMVYKTRNITIGACLFPFMAFISYIYDPYQSSIQIVRIVRTVTYCALM